MTFRQFCILFLRQSTFALAIFVAFCLATEAIFPGFAAPFVNIPVLALLVVSLVFVAASSSLMRGSADNPAEGMDSSRRGNDTIKKLSIIFVGLLCLCALAYLLTALAPLGTITLIRFIAIACVCLLSAILFWKNPSSYD